MPKNDIENMDVELKDVYSSSDSAQPAGDGRRKSRAMSGVLDAISSQVAANNKSPFVKHEEEPKKTRVMEATHFVSGKFFSNLPAPDILHNLTPPRIVGFGLFAYFIYVVIFLGFAFSGYDQARKEEFVSLKEDAGECTLVEKPLTGFFIGGNNGKWGGDPGFLESEGAYEFTFSSLKASPEEFANELQKIKENELTTIGTLQNNSGLAYNLIMLMHFSTEFTVGGKTQLFGFTADPGDVFYREYVLPSLRSVDANCALQPTMSYDQTFGRMSLEYSYTEYNAEGCNAVAKPESLGYMEDYDGDTFTLDMDLVTMTSVLAINLGYLNKSSLQPIGNAVYNEELDVLLLKHFDKRFPRMQPMQCFFSAIHDDIGDDDDATDDYDDDDATDDYDDDFLIVPPGLIGKCIISHNDKWLIPAMYHYGEECDNCEGPYDGYCDTFDLVVSFVYFEQNNTNRTISLLNKYPNFKELNGEVGRAYHSGDYSFCDNECSLLSVNIYDFSDQFVSPQFYSVYEGHCADSTFKESFDLLGQLPPTDLVEEYYRCKNTKTTSFFTSVGIANSNMMLFAPLVCLLLLPILIKLYHDAILREEMVTPEFSNDDKDLASRAWATYLLKLTQKKDVGYDPETVVAQLAKELTAMGAQDEANSIKST